MNRDDVIEKLAEELTKVRGIQKWSNLVEGQKNWYRQQARDLLAAIPELAIVNEEGK